MECKDTPFSGKVYLFKAAPEEDANRDTGGGGTATDKNNVAVTSGDRFITLLNSLEIENQLVPVLAFEYLDLSNLWRHLKRPAEHTGIILTSPRCVYSISEAIKSQDNEGDWDRGLRSAWESKYLFCVGPSTISSAKQVFPSLKTELVVTGSESHAESLANKVIEVNSTEALNLPLLYPCGVLRRDVLLNMLKKENIACVQCTVYESITNPVLATVLESVAEKIKKSRGQKETLLCFFSPSGVKNVFEHLDANLLDCQLTNIVAIGPTTKTALEEHFITQKIRKHIFQCENPTPEALLGIIKSLHSA